MVGFYTTHGLYASLHSPTSAADLNLLTGYFHNAVFCLAIRSGPYL